MIKLLRNREVCLYFELLAAVGGAGVVAVWLLGGAAAGGTALAAMGLLVLLSMRVTARRYSEIAQLSDCLARISAGDYDVDLRQYCEGELSILYDELHKVTRTLSHQADALRRDKQWLADTMADISHQLKTPLTAVSMFTDLLEGDGLSAGKRAEFIAGIRVSTERIRWLVQSLLKLSRLDADAVVLQQEAIPVEALVQQAIVPLRIPIELGGQTLSLELDGAVLRGDLAWLSEALGNLVKNCVEHTPAGGTVGVRCRENALYTLLEVWDTGPGIAPDDLPHIFERFYRGKNAAAGSIGIGLALSRTIFQRHGAAVDAGNRPAGGACFTVKFFKTVV